jgi:hypothetical protein
VIATNELATKAREDHRSLKGQLNRLAAARRSLSGSGTPDSELDDIDAMRRTSVNGLLLLERYMVEHGIRFDPVDDWNEL